MPLTVYWLNHRQSVLVYEIVAPWTMGEFYNALIRASELQASVDAPIFILYDFRQGERFPRDFLSGINEMMRRRRESVYLRIVVGANVLLHVMYRLVRTISPQLGEKFVFVDTMHEALVLLDTYTPNTPPA